MSIRFYCPQGHRLKVPPAKAGKAARCPVCQQRVVVPLESPPAPARPQSDGSRHIGSQPDRSVVSLAAVSDQPRAAPPTPPGQSPRVAVEPPPLAPVAAVGLGSATSSPGQAISEPPPPHPHQSSPSAPPSAASTLENPPAGDAPQPVAVRRPWWATFDPTLPRKAYCLVEPGKRQLVRWTALAVALLACFQAAPAVRFLNLLYAPEWAKWVVVLAALQVGFAMYLAILPSWPSLWTTMVVLGGLAAIYAAAMAIVAATPAGRPLLFELDDWRRTAAPWAACNVLLLGLLAYGCGRTATRWQRSWTLAYARRSD